MASMNTRLNIKNLDRNSIQKHGGSKQVGFKQLGPVVKKRIHGVHVQSVLFEVGLLEAQGDCEAEAFWVSNNDVVVAQRGLEKKKLKVKTNTNCLVKEEGNVHLGIKVRADIMVTRVPGQEVQSLSKVDTVGELDLIRLGFGIVGIG
ncbi:hypothetical protein Tco_1004572 [Tanacetum coccineum]|uniref:Uncharacterized protein n=1 Tax=Tanacetum coccineum TaxID=301880 RepID=A0ABQ5FDE3_9ASTR